MAGNGVKNGAVGINKKDLTKMKRLTTTVDNENWLKDNGFIHKDTNVWEKQLQRAADGTGPSVNFIDERADKLRQTFIPEISDTPVFMHVRLSYETDNDVWIDENQPQSGDSLIFNVIAVLATYDYKGEL